MRSETARRSEEKKYVEHLKILRDKRNSLLYWFPKLRGLNIPLPRTEVLELDESSPPLYNFLYENFDNFPLKLRDEIFATARKIGFPLFLRTDVFSGKHNWEDACYVENETLLMGHIHDLIEGSECVGMVGLDIRAFVFREFLELDWRFKAFRNMPVARERRYFIKDGEVICHHPYWFEEAIQKGFHRYKLPSDWREILHELNTEFPIEKQLLTDYAERVAKVLDGYWSVDFAMTRKGVWYLIDMALGKASEHDEKCTMKVQEQNE